jgi:hypothetical protein
MTNWKNLLLLFSLTLNIAVLGTLLYFWGYHDGPPPVNPGPGMERPEPFPPAWGNMDLREHQRRELMMLRAPFHKQMMEMRRNLDMDRQKLLQLMLAQPAVPDSIERMLGKISEKQIRLDRMTVDHLLAIRPHLDEKQWRVMLDQLVRDRREARERPFNRPRRF